MKILIIAIRYKLYHAEMADYDYNIPVGLAYISAILKNDGHEVKWLNLNHCDGSVDDVVRERLSRENFDFVLTGGLSVFYPSIKSCVEAARKYAPYTRIVVGGGAISSQPELTFRGLKPDYLVIGEGEQTVLELFRCLEKDGDLDRVSGIGYCGPEGKLVFTRAREAITDLDSLPYPDYEGLGIDAYLDHMLASNNAPYYDLFDYPRPYPLISSRSCPFSCTFCFHPLGKGYRRRSVPNIIGELNFAIKRYRINIINIYDELFSYDKERVYEFCEEIRQLSKTVPWEIKWNCQIRVDKLDEDLLLTMKGAGCYILSLGLESYSPTVLKSMNKGITPEQIDRTLQMTHRLNMTVQGNFIFFDPAETKETAYETLNYWKKSVYSGGGVNLDYIQPYPGTSVYRHCVDKGIIKDEFEFLENISTRIAKPINMSNSMTDKEFRQFYIDIYEAERKYHKYVEPLSVAQDNGLSEIHVKCPYCSSISIYKNYIFDRYSYGAQHICCRKCRIRFYLPPIILRFEILLIELIGAKSVYSFKNVYLLNRFAKSILKIIRYIRRTFPIFSSISHTMAKGWGRGEPRIDPGNL